MAKVTDIANMKQRVAAKEAKLYAALGRRKRNARLLDLFDAIEKNLAHRQQQIVRLEEEQGRVLEEVQQLRNLLHDMLTMAESEHERGPRLPASDHLDQLIDRLGTVTSNMNQDAEDGIGGDGTKKPAARSVGKRFLATIKRAGTKKPTVKASPSSG